MNQNLRRASVIVALSSLAACGSGGPEQVGGATPASTTATQVAASSTAAPSTAANNGISPASLTKEVMYTTGGEYVNNNGFKADIKISVYKPVLLTAGQGAACSGKWSSEDPSKIGPGSIVVATDVDITSPDSRFPFPLAGAELLAGQHGHTGVPLGSLQLTGEQTPDTVSSVCNLAQTDSSGHWITLAALTPPEATPDNPGGLILNCPDSTSTLQVGDPLGQSEDVRSMPKTQYGPTNGGWSASDVWWNFLVKLDGKVRSGCATFDSSAESDTASVASDFSSAPESAKASEPSKSSTGSFSVNIDNLEPRTDTDMYGNIVAHSTVTFTNDTGSTLTNCNTLFEPVTKSLRPHIYNPSQVEGSGVSWKIDAGGVHTSDANPRINPNDASGRQLMEIWAVCGAGQNLSSASTFIWLDMAAGSATRTSGIVRNAPLSLDDRNSELAN